MAHFFILDIAYTQGAEAVDPYLEDHRRYLTRHYEDGRFPASGRKDPRIGGVIIAVGTRGEVSEIVSEDPFVVNGVAEYTITEFIPTMTTPDLENYREVLWTIKRTPQFIVESGS